MDPTAAAPTREEARPAYLPPLAFATLCYLAVEFAFNARVLDVMGGRSAPAEIVAVASWGRLVSGVALTLAVWGTFLLPRAAARGWGWRRTVPALALSGAMCVGGAWVAEKEAVDWAVESSGGAARRTAAQMQVLSAAVQDGSAAIAGVDLSVESLARPEGKAFLAIFPFVAMSSQAVSSNPGDIMRQVFRAFAERRFGTAEQTYNDVFIPSVRALRDSFNRYVAAQRRLADDIAAVPVLERAAWAGLVAAQPTKERAPSVAAALGAPVGAGWRAGDRRGFSDAFVAAARARAEAAYAEDVQDALRMRLAPGMGWEAFTALDEIQARWRTALGAPPGSRLSPGMGFAAYEADVFEPAIDAVVHRDASPLVGDADAYGPGGDMEATGRAAMEWLLVPPIALALSLLGALVHVFKVSDFGLRLLVPGLRGRRLVAASAVLAIGLGVFLAPNRISASDAFAHCEERTRESFGAAAALTARWIVQAQPFFYPLGEAARRLALFGYEFGPAEAPAAPPPTASASLR